MRESLFATNLIQSHDALVVRLPSNAVPAIADVRAQGIEHFRRVGVPTMRDEAWKYTNLRAIEKNEFRMSLKQSNDLQKSDIAKLRIDSCDTFRMVFVDGWFCSMLSDLEDLPQGVEVKSLAAVVNRNGPGNADRLLDRVLKQLQAASKNPAHGFQAINTAFAADGAIVSIANAGTIEKPIELLFVSSGAESRSFCNLNNFVFVEGNSDIAVIERYVPLTDAEYLNNSSISVDIGANARCSHYRIQNESSEAHHIASANVLQQGSSKYRFCTVSVGASLDRHEITQVLNDEHAECELSGLCVGQGRQHIDNYTNIVHESPRGTSREYYKGILNDRARSVFHGRIRVAPGAQGTDAEQQNRNLLLSRDAEADTKPQLEIYADDVKCAHGATVGQLDEDAIFYLRSRGLGNEEARAVLTQAFATDIIDGIELDGVRKHVEQLIQNALNMDLDLKRAA